MKTNIIQTYFVWNQFWVTFAKFYFLKNYSDWIFYGWVKISWSASRIITLKRSYGYGLKRKNLWVFLMELKPWKSINVESSTLSIPTNAQLFQKNFALTEWCSMPIYSDNDWNHETCSFLETEEKFPSEATVFSFNLLCFITCRRSVITMSFY